ncbi:MAG: hypothetical protein IJV72_04155 [Clostridia bacterium]|nr:hypothetical protein [Clostridia bacterium]
MRKKAAQERKNGVSGRGVVSGLTRCYAWEFASVSEYIYYSLLLEREYPELSDMFERAALDCIERFRAIGGIILSLGYNPALNMQIRHSGERYECLSFENIDRILASSAERERSSIAALDGLVGICEDCDTVNRIGRIISEKSEFLTMLERMIRS